MARKKLDLEEVKSFIDKQSPESKVYIGCDSQRYKKYGEWVADYCLVVVVHINGKNGCKIFHEITTEKDYATGRKPKPNYRLMQECYKVSEMYLSLYDVLINREVQLHLDINPNPRYASNEVVQQAIGYIKGTCDISPEIKPAAWAATHAADHLLAA